MALLLNPSAKTNESANENPRRTFRARSAGVRMSGRRGFRLSISKVNMSL